MEGRSFTSFFALAVVLQVLRGSFNYLSQIGATYLGTAIQAETQRRVYQQILSLDFPCVHRYSIGDLLEYAKTADLLVCPLIDSVNRVLVSFLGIGASITVMLFLSPTLTAIALGVFGVLGALQKILIKKISSHSQELSRHSVEFSKQTVQTLNGLRAIHTFHRQSRVLEKIQNILTLIAKTTRKLQLWNHAIAPINEITGVLIVGTFLILGQTLLGNQHPALLSLLLTFITIVYRLNGRIQVFVSTMGGVALTWGNILRLEEILSPAGKEFLPSGGKSFPGLKHSIVFQDLTLHYPAAKSPSVDTLNFEVFKGETVAFVGSSGSGKSSLMDLLLRLYEPTRGAILVDGENLAHYNVGTWRSQLGVVSQDIFLFNQTIEENIRFGAPEASLEKIIEATQIAGAHSFINSLEQKYSSVLGERGHRLSGGEKQRLTLARALVKDPEILILDEATSSLDSHSESLIQRAIEQLKGTKTIFIVAHRLSTIQHADRIFVMEKGKILEWGSHQELLDHQGAYARLWAVQTKKNSLQTV